MDGISPFFLLRIGAWGRRWRHASGFFPRDIEGGSNIMMASHHHLPTKRKAVRYVLLWGVPPVHFFYVPDEKIRSSRRRRLSSINT